MMTREELEQVKAYTDEEGLHYTLTSMTSFPEVQDPEFHRLRLRFVSASEAIESYLEEEEARHATNDNKELT